MPESAETIEGKAIKFVCKASGKPTPTIVWLKDDKPIEENELLKVISKEKEWLTQSEMVFPDARIEHESQKYKVQVSNVAGIIEEEFSLAGKKYRLKRNGRNHFKSAFKILWLKKNLKICIRMFIIDFREII